MALIHGRSAEGEEVKSTNPVLIGAKDINGNAILLTTDAEGKLRVATDLEIASVTATDVTIHDPTTPGNKLKINADGSLPVQLSGRYLQYSILAATAPDNVDYFIGIDGVKRIWGGSTVTPFPLGQCSLVEIILKNNYDKALINVQLLFTAVSTPMSTSVSALPNLFSSAASHLSAGAKRDFRVATTPELGYLAAGVVIKFTQNISPTTGSLDAYMMGRQV